MLRGNELRHMRKTMGLTQDDMANAMGISRSHYPRLENTMGQREVIVPQKYELAARWLFHDRQQYHFLISNDGKVYPLAVRNYEEARTLGYKAGDWDKEARVQFWHEPPIPDEMTSAEEKAGAAIYEQWSKFGHPDPKDMEGSIRQLVTGMWLAFKNAAKMLPARAPTIKPARVENDFNNVDPRTWPIPGQKS